MSYDASDPNQVAAVEKKVKRRETKREGVLTQLMSHAEGRDWIFGILEMCGIFQTSFSTNALQMAYSEGSRNVGLRLMADLMKFAPRQYLMMLEERESNGRTDTDS